MENNLIQTAKSYINDEALNRIAQSTGESTESLKSGLDAIIPSIFLALQNQSGTGLSGILEQVKSYFSTHDFQQSFAEPTDDPTLDQAADRAKENSLLHTLFGNNIDTVVSTLSNFLHLKSSSVKDLARLALPAVFGSLTANGTNWNSSSITNLLDEHKSNFASAIPSSIGLAAFGTSYANLEPDIPIIPPVVDSEKVDSPPTTPPIDVDHPVPPVTPVDPTPLAKEPVIDPVKDVVVNDSVIAQAVEEKHHERVQRKAAEEPPFVHTPESVKKNSRGAGYWWLLIPILLIVAWMVFGKGCSNDKPTSTVDTSSSANSVAIVDSGMNNDSIASRQDVTIALPNGENLNAYASGIEENLVAFLNSDYKSLSDEELKNKWFDFDYLNFETETATITEDSRNQLQNLNKILKAYPDAKIKIGGYTDKTGNEAYNKKLSLDRANAVKTFLTAEGSGAQVIDTEGYGSEHAKYEASAPESDRITDRRISVSVRK
ncbi:OmpA family protein [Sphingobacterium hungaricum]|uniref:Flagellar motor protein MotB n=1 Tax=Sphingobacterium hungaricum TaxID=2082723 RepID=A0A928UVW6_9SPHI|nr:OmpA family protein [Sphingobacterium hungaricum]MBE8712491.1 flagellar motor protein MotB [Sphingobacterium hungaricum]